MAHKKKFFTLLLVLLFILLYANWSITFGSTDYSLNFTQNEVAQINTFFNSNYDIDKINTAYNTLKSNYPSISKMNIIFVNGLSGLGIYINNGSFDNSINYLGFTSADSSNFYNRYYVDSTTTSTGARVTLKNNGLLENDIPFSAGWWSLAYNQNDINGLSVSNGDTINSKWILTTVPTASFYVYGHNVFSYNYITLDGWGDEEQEPSGESVPSGTITNPSGEVTGQIDLSGIENSLSNIENKITSSGEMQDIISGEVSKITNVLTESGDTLIDNTVLSSGDITSALGFQLAEDRYSNFWLTLTNNLKTALLGSVRSIDISFMGKNWTISLDEYLVLPVWLVAILTPITTCLLTWVVVRQVKLIFDKISSGNVDNLLKENSEEGISNLF